MHGLALSFKEVRIDDSNENTLLRRVNGYLPSGGLLGVIGGSGSGKSLLMRSMCGLVMDCNFDGQIIVDGISKKFGGFVGGMRYNHYHESKLISSLSPREMLTFSALMRGVNLQGNKYLDLLVSKLCLTDVFDKMTSPWLRAGLSDIQKRCLNICNELISPPPILLFDDVFSGMDSSITYDILSTLRTLQKEESMSIVLSIHQPTPRISELFDQVLILGNKEAVFFGTISELQSFMTRIDSRFYISSELQPIDHFLEAIHLDPSEEHNVRYGDAFVKDELYLDLMKKINGNPEELVVSVYRLDKMTPTSASGKELEQKPSYTNSWSLKVVLNNVFYLIWRNLVIGFRDLAFFPIQLAIIGVAGLFSGLIFMTPQVEIGREVYVALTAISVTPDIILYLMIIKLKQAVQNKEICQHESSQRSYSLFSFWLAEIIANSIMLISFLPGILFPFFLIGFPLASFPFVLMVFFSVSTYSIDIHKDSQVLLSTSACYGGRRSRALLDSTVQQSGECIYPLLRQCGDIDGV